jgi:hypothetical protein
MKDQKNMYPRKTIHEKSRRIIYEFSYKMGVLNEKRCKRGKSKYKSNRSHFRMSLLQRLSRASLVKFRIDYVLRTP